MGWLFCGDRVGVRSQGAWQKANPPVHKSVAEPTVDRGLRWHGQL